MPADRPQVTMRPLLVGSGAVLVVVALILLFIVISVSSRPQCTERPYVLSGCPAEGSPPSPPIFGLVTGAFLGLGVVAVVYGVLSRPSPRLPPGH